MLLRAFRLTDKLSLLLLKGSAALSALVADGVLTILGSPTGERRGLLGLIARFLNLIYRVVLFIAGIIGGIIAFIVSRIANLLGGTTSMAASATVRLSGQTASAARTGTRQAMARRAARAEIDAGIPEDPLLMQNRVLSGLVVMALMGLIAVVLWATRPQTASLNLPVGNVSLGGSPLAAATEEQGSQSPLERPTPIPTATQVPEVLQARGSMVFTVRENGQTDLWALNVTSRTPIRLTNNVADERDPVWLPDGRQLAYASNKDGNWEIYVFDMQRAGDPSYEPRRMTYNLAFEAAPSWSPDGNYLAYETYQDGNLDIYVLPVNNPNETLSSVTQDPAADFSPAWAPGGRKIAFVSWRDGNQDIYVFSLDTFDVVNITNTPNRNEDYPAWHPNADVEIIAYSAVDQGVEKVFVKDVNAPDAIAQPIGAGRDPSWSPDGTSILAAVDTVDATHLTAYPYENAAAPQQFFQVPLGATNPTWGSEPLPAALVNSGGLPLLAEQLYIEQEARIPNSDLYALSNLDNVQPSDAASLSVRVDDSFNALRKRVLALSGRDFLGSLEAAFWPLETRIQAGEEARNWHYTGRAFSVNRSAAEYGLPRLLEIVREDRQVDTVWRLYLRVDDDAAGQLGEPLRRMPWDLAARVSSDGEAYNQGGKLKAAMPEGYYLDLTQVAADYGWQPLPAGPTWRSVFNAMNYWTFFKPGGLSWVDAMLEIYQPPQLGGFLPTPTPFAPVPTFTPEGASN